MKGGQAQHLAFLTISVTLDLSKICQSPGKLYYVTIYCVVIWVFRIPLSLSRWCFFAEPMLLASCITWPKIARIISIASGILWWQHVTYASSCIMTKASSRYRLRCTSLTGNLFTSTTAWVTIETIFLDRSWIYRIWEWSQVVLVQFSMVRAFQKALTVDFGIKSTYKHSHIQKIDDSYVKICESSCCVLAAFSICSCCECL
jgi:hypothetical protein